MCGICGIVYLDSEAPVHSSDLQEMVGAMHHRGPDDEGMYTGMGIGLGMRRLSIIDVLGGAQPVRNEDGSKKLVFNGEIYNFRDLRLDMKRRGHAFSTESDTEVIIHLYEEYGEDCVEHLRGMFAFALWDESERKLLLGRDRLGIKPLYYWGDGKRLVFASEVRALLASGLVPRRLSLPGLYSYLSFGSVQEPLTLIEGVHSIPPGHYMTVTSAHGNKARGQFGSDHRAKRISLQRYWDFPTVAHPQKSSDSKALDELKELLNETVAMHMVADVPLGAFLSGGIDSGAVVALMSRIGGNRVNTFTIAFDETQFNEAPLARMMADRFSTEHTEVRVTGSQVLQELPRSLEAMDQPTIDGINTYYVSEAAKRAGLTVALSGLGGDEVFGGYSTFSTVPALQTIHRLASHVPANVRSFVGPLSASLYPLSSDAQRKMTALLAGSMPFSHPYFLARAVYTPLQVSKLFAGTAWDGLGSDDPWQSRVTQTLTSTSNCDPTTSVSYLESSHYLVSTLLRDTDQMSMAHSLEVRVPLIDHRLVEFVMGLPEEIKTGRSRNGGMLGGLWHATRRPEISKWLLVEALDGMLPPQVVHREKSTFTFPWEYWLRGPLRKDTEHALLHVPEPLQGLIDPKMVEKIWHAFLTGRTSWSRPWALHVLFKWVEGQRVGS